MGLIPPGLDILYRLVLCMLVPQYLAPAFHDSLVALVPQAMIVFLVSPELVTLFVAALFKLVLPCSLPDSCTHNNSLISLVSPVVS